MSKLIVVIGVTGNQGGSVAQAFLNDPEYEVRGLTRNPSSPKAQQLAAQGIKILQAEINDVSTLIPAFAGANAIFSVTQYWEPFFRPDCRAKAQQLGVTCRRYAYDVELQQGKNIVDAAATTVDTLDENGFLVSTLSHAGKCSNGKFTELYHFDSKADVYPDYVKKRYPELYAKMSCIHTGYFASSYNLAVGAYFRKISDHSYQMRFTTHPEAPVPHLAVNEDTGRFVYLVSKLPPGGTYMCAGTTCSWAAYMYLWSRVTGKDGYYGQITTQQMIDESPDKDFGREIADMFEYSSSPGYDGGMKNILGFEEVRQLVKKQNVKSSGYIDQILQTGMLGLEEWMKREDWSAVLSQPVAGPA